MAIKALETNNEETRLIALEKLGLDYSKPEERFERITHVASVLFDVPIAMINIVTADRIRFKSCVGLTHGDTIDRSHSFCSLAADQEEPLMVQDARLDDYFKTNPLVIGDLKIRSYTGKSLHAADGSRVGTLCLLDKKPRKYTHEQLGLLENLAKWAELELNYNSRLA